MTCEYCGRGGSIDDGTGNCRSCGAPTWHRPTNYMSARNAPMHEWSATCCSAGGWIRPQPVSRKRVILKD